MKADLRAENFTNITADIQRGFQINLYGIYSSALKSSQYTMMSQKLNTWKFMTFYC